VYEIAGLLNLHDEKKGKSPRPSFKNLANSCRFGGEKRVQSHYLSQVIELKKGLVIKRMNVQTWQYGNSPKFEHYSKGS